MCTGSDFIARVPRTRLPYAENLVSGVLLGACGVRVRSGRSCVRGAQVEQTENGPNSFVSKRSKNGPNSAFFRGGGSIVKLVLYSRTQAPDLVNRNRSTLGHARQAAMAELSGSQPSGPSQSSLFHPGEPPPPQEGVLAARNVEETFVWVLRRRGGNTQQKGQTMDYNALLVPVA